MHHFITGVAGFIGSQLADSLLKRGDSVSGADDLSLGKIEHLNSARLSDEFRFFEVDFSLPPLATDCLCTAGDWRGQPDLIWHLAANSDIAAGVANLQVDFDRTLRTTFSVIEAARHASVRRVAFASSSAIYGEHADALTEDSGPLLPISNYGATKLASEALLSAAAETILEQIWVFRFPNVVGSRATHGVIHDFIARLHGQPSKLIVLGDGSQSKPYLHVSELIEAMQFIVAKANDRRNVFNIGPAGASTSVSFIAERTVARAAPGTPIEYGTGDRGWPGDVPRFQYLTDKLASLGWSPKLSSDAAVMRAIDELSAAAFVGA